MKIISLKFRNINNLKGDNEVSFDAEPLNNAGIFAITGPTGSGKSTLLDVITLSLFNKIPRFKSSISKSDIEGLGSVMTHHTDEAFASVTYQIHGSVYTSSWSVGKTRTGRLKDYEMFIYDDTGKPLDLKKSEVPSKNEEIIGLKYDQFVKSIILSQGQFSRFLKAGKHERGQLLENITGTEIYRKVSMAAYEKFKLVRDEVALEKDRLDQIQVMTDEEVKLLVSERETKESASLEIEKNLEKFNRSKKLKSDIATFSQSLLRKEEEQKNLLEEIENNKAQITQLSTYEKLSPILGELTRFEDAQNNEKALVFDIETNQKTLVEANSSLQMAMQEMAFLTGADINVDNFNQEMSAFEKKVLALQQQLSFTQNSGKESRDKLDVKMTQSNLDLSRNPETAIPILQENQQKNKKKITDAGFTEETDQRQINQISAQYLSELDIIKSLVELYRQRGKMEVQIKETQTELGKAGESIEALLPQSELLDKLIRTTKEKIVVLEKRRQDTLLISSLIEHRNRLVDGEPCPLCGALDHPYSDHLPEAGEEEEGQLNQAKSELEKLEGEYSHINEKLTEYRTSQHLMGSQLKTASLELESIQTEQKKIASQYKGQWSIAASDIQKSLIEVEGKLVKLHEVSSALREYQLVTELIEDFEALQIILDRHRQISKEIRNIYEGEDVSADCNTIQDKFVRSNTQISSLQTMLNTHTNALNQTRTALVEFRNILDPKVKELGFNSIDEAASFVITEEELNRLRLQKEAWENRTVAIKTEIKTLIEHLDKRKEADEMPTVTLQQLDLSIQEMTGQRASLLKTIGEISAHLEKDDQDRLKIKSKETELQQLQTKLEKWTLLNRLIGEKTGNKFANFAQGLTLQNLLVYANERLKKLSDRYLLDKPSKDGALTIIDQYQGNIQRSVTTLSGGESFLISLALALSLWDMASKNVNLESLFIDEGFGTLDYESLDVAMNTLERLQTESQKIVGVISHVEALKERIHTQIKLQKNAQGYGQLKIVG